MYFTIFLETPQAWEVFWFQNVNGINWVDANLAWTKFRTFTANPVHMHIILCH